MAQAVPICDVCFVAMPCKECSGPIKPGGSPLCDDCNPEIHFAAVYATFEGGEFHDADYNVFSQYQYARNCTEIWERSVWAGEAQGTRIDIFRIEDFATSKVDPDWSLYDRWTKRVPSKTVFLGKVPREERKLPCGHGLDSIQSDGTEQLGIYFCTECRGQQ
jgi:hypothetical protein